MNKVPRELRRLYKSFYPDLRKQRMWQNDLRWAASQIALSILDNFEQMVRDGYDGIHATFAGEAVMRRLLPWFLPWDCESTVWFSWKFAEVLELGIVNEVSLEASLDY